MVLAIPTVLFPARDQLARLPPLLELRTVSAHSSIDPTMAAMPLLSADPDSPADHFVVPSVLGSSVRTEKPASQPAIIRQADSRLVRSGQASAGRFAAKQSSKGERGTLVATNSTGKATSARSSVVHAQQSRTPSSMSSLNVALARCAEQSIFARTWCEHRARTQYCDSHSGLHSACAMYASNEVR